VAQSIETLFASLFQAGTLYPMACAAGLAAATPFALLQACLGQEFDPFCSEIRLCYPPSRRSSMK
jgi:hypothetical protein